MYYVFFGNPVHGQSFQNGERLVFQIKWSFIPAGTATLEVLPDHNSSHQAAHHFVLTAKTNKVLDVLYKYRERVDSFVNSKVERSILYKKNQQGRTNRDIVVNFDWNKYTAQYMNFGKKIEPISIEEGTLDPLSSLYFIRNKSLSEGEEITRPVTDGKETVLGRVRVLKREFITINNRKYDTFKLEPELKHVKGVFEKSKDAKLHIWVTADHKKMLVKVKSKVVIGSFIAELIEHNYDETTDKL